MTPGQKELMSIVKTIQLGKMPSMDRSRQQSSHKVKKLFPVNETENHMTSIEGIASLEGSFDDGNSL